MAQDPEEEGGGGDTLDTSHELDFVTIYESNAVDAETEADVIAGLLESNDVPTTVVRGTPLPPAGIAVQVPRGRLAEARRLIEEAQAEGAEGAAEAEANSEGEQ